MGHQQPRCWFCGSPASLENPLKNQQFHVRVNGKPILERHKVCLGCEKVRLKNYH